jgi:hypothetical protein
MSFATGLARARSHIVFVVGLLAATGIILSIEDRLAQPATPLLPSTGKATLDSDERAAAVAAWRVFDSQDARDDHAAYLTALAAAGPLGLLPPAERHRRIDATMREIEGGAGGERLTRALAAVAVAEPRFAERARTVAARLPRSQASPPPPATGLLSPGAAAAILEALSIENRQEARS